MVSGNWGFSSYHKEDYILDGNFLKPLEFILNLYSGLIRSKVSGLSMQVGEEVLIEAFFLDDLYPPMEN